MPPIGPYLVRSSRNCPNSWFRLDTCGHGLAGDEHGADPTEEAAEQGENRDGSASRSYRSPLVQQCLQEGKQRKQCEQVPDLRRGPCPCDGVCGTDRRQGLPRTLIG
jgi:hypothetical protein